MLSFIGKAVNLWRKIFIVIIVYVTVVSLFSYFIKKDRPRISTNIIQRNREKIYSFINDKKINSEKGGKILTSLYRVTTCQFMGEACTNNPADGDNNYKKSFVAGVSNLMIIPFTNPPASGVYWVRDSLAKAGFIPNIYAAEGLGFGSIKPFTKVWLAMRDAAYLILVLVIITIGFMIMFRTKINPQTVISIENALPKIVLALIYITFSFAIAGFLIDLMYVSIALIISILGSIDTPTAGWFWQSPKLSVPEMQQLYITAGPLNIFNGLMGNKAGLSFDMFNKIFWDLPNALLNIVPEVGVVLRLISSLTLGAFLIFPWIYKNFLSDTFGGLDLQVGVVFANLTGLVKALLSGSITIITLVIVFFVTPIIIFPILLGGVIFLTVILLFFRILFLLFSAYTKLLLMIILAPLYLLIEAVPGQSAFTGWLKNIVNELITFPVLVAIFVLSMIISDNAATGNLVQLPFLVGIDANSFGFMIGMWFLFMAPDLVKLVQQMINPKPLPLDAGLGVFFGGASTGVSTGLEEMGKYALLAQSFSPLKRIYQMIPGFGKKFGEK